MTPKEAEARMTLSTDIEEAISRSGLGAREVADTLDLLHARFSSEADKAAGKRSRRP